MVYYIIKFKNKIIHITNKFDETIQTYLVIYKSINLLDLMNSSNKLKIYVYKHNVQIDKITHKNFTTKNYLQDYYKEFNIINEKSLNKQIVKLEEEI